MPHDQPYLQAEKKIKEALKSGATELDLSNEYKTPDEKKLTELPESIGKLKQLTLLKLSYNQLTALPVSLGGLTQLQTLNLSDNQLTTLPDSLGQLTQLTELDLSSNQLTTLPNSLGQLTQLTELDLSNNQLTTLPDSLGQLTQLTELRLSSNQLTTLPDSLRQLTQLQNMDISFNGLKVLPDWLGELRLLVQLNLFSNEFTSLPPSLEQLVNLRGIYLESDEPWLEFPIQIRKMNKIETIQFRGGVSSLPNWITELEHLETLELRGNSLNPALKSAYDACKPGNYEPLWAYLRSLEQNAEPLYEAKLVLVGEGNVGKTTLLKALKGNKDEAPQKNEPTTHGVEIDIHGLRLPHPAFGKDGVEIQLNAWDFGGQESTVSRISSSSAAVRSTCWSGSRVTTSSRGAWMSGLI